METMERDLGRELNVRAAAIYTVCKIRVRIAQRAEQREKEKREKICFIELGAVAREITSGDRHENALCRPAVFRH